ncbi:hypothetical protein TNCV_5112551 [Trichonephila clavipes]|nr:hypothetical protein TNCV_5112551 [Trichonephila clavipes]
MQGHGTTPLKVKEDIGDVSSELDNPFTADSKLPNAIVFYACAGVWGGGGGRKGKSSEIPSLPLSMSFYCIPKPSA